MAAAKRKASAQAPKASLPALAEAGGGGALDRFFDLTAAGSSVTTELRARRDESTPL